MAEPKKSEDLGECAYCSNAATTRDHIPPQTIFAKGTQNKPWVPACHNCNKGATKDDEYMQRIALLWGADVTKDALDVEERFMRALQREEAKGLQADLLASLSPLGPAEELLFPGGINLALKGERLGRIVDKLVRGWWFKLTKGNKIPSNHSIMKYTLGDRRQDNPVYEFNEREIVKIPGFFLGDYAFTFQLAYCQKSRLTCWLFRFYKVFAIMAYTCKVEENGDFQILDLRTPYCTIDDLAGAPVSDSPTSKRDD